MATQDVSEKQCSPVYCVKLRAPRKLTVVSPHLVPFRVQTYSMPPSPAGGSPAPMATHLAAAAHDTSSSEPNASAFGTGGGVIGVSAVPFQLSMAGRMSNPMAEFRMVSPATRQYAALQDTPFSTVSDAPRGVGTGTGVHLPARHRAAVGRKPGDLPVTVFTPTDRQAVAEPQETAFPSPRKKPCGLACGRAGMSRPPDDAALAATAPL